MKTKLRGLVNCNKPILLVYSLRTLTPRQVSASNCFFMMEVSWKRGIFNDSTDSDTVINNSLILKTREEISLMSIKKTSK